MLITEDGNLLIKYTAVVNASTHRCFGTPLFLIKVKPISTICRCFLSDTPFIQFKLPRTRDRPTFDSFSHKAFLPIFQTSLNPGLTFTCEKPISFNSFGRQLAIHQSLFHISLKSLCQSLNKIPIRKQIGQAIGRRLHSAHQERILAPFSLAAQNPYYGLAPGLPGIEGDQSLDDATLASRVFSGLPLLLLLLLKLGLPACSFGPFFDARMLVSRQNGALK